MQDRGDRQEPMQQTYLRKNWEVKQIKNLKTERIFVEMLLLLHSSNSIYLGF